jgi:hypothetical protein
MGSGATKLIQGNEVDLGPAFCSHIHLASIDAEHEGDHFIRAFASWRGIVEVGQRHMETIVPELGEWAAAREQGGAPPPEHWRCFQTEKRFGGTEISMQLFGGVEMTIFVPSQTDEGNDAAERWHKAVGNLARDAAALRHARYAF